MPDRYQTPWITAGAAATHIFSHGYQYIFGTLSSTDLLGYTTGDFLGSLVDAGKLKKNLAVALALENTDHGVEYGAGIKRWTDEHPGYFRIVFNEKFDLGSTDFSGLLQKVKSAKADIYLVDAHLQDYITMERQYVQTGMYHQMLSYGARGPDSDARKALGDATNYIFAGFVVVEEASVSSGEEIPLRITCLPGVYGPRAGFLLPRYCLRRDAGAGDGYRAGGHAK